MKLGVLLLTYDRLAYASRTIQSLATWLQWPEEMHIHIGDDGSPDAYRAQLMDLAESFWPQHGLTVSNSNRGGYGANYNLALPVLHGTGVDVVLTLEDDWECQRPLALRRYARAFGHEIQSIRFGYIGYTADLNGTVRYIEDTPFLLLDPNSPERHVPAGHPRLETTHYQREVGPWTEGLDPGATEFDWCGREPARQKVAWPMDVRPSPGDLFAHVGTIQARQDQRP